MNFKKSHRVHFGSKGDIFAFIEYYKEEFSIKLMCKLYELTRAGYYKWRIRGLSQRAVDDEWYSNEIKRVHPQSERRYGSPRVHEQLNRENVQISRRRSR